MRLRLALKIWRTMTEPGGRRPYSRGRVAVAEMTLECRRRGTDERMYRKKMTWTEIRRWRKSLERRRIMFEAEKLKAMFDELELYEITDPEIVPALDKLVSLFKSKPEIKQETE